jgi:hypothetical protein
MDSKRTKAFKKLYITLPDHVKESARKQYKYFLENQSHPSLRTKLIGSTRNNKFKVYEVTVGMGYRATYFRDGDVYVWFWIGTHNSFDRKY